jgi:transcriptional regulator with PAS, ATPase and Fis domain
LEARDIDFGARSISPQNMSVEDFSSSLKDGKSKFTASFVNRVLERNDGNRARTAKELGISERSLYRLLASDKTDSPN